LLAAASCALDVADEGKHTDAQVAAHVGGLNGQTVTRARVTQIAASSLVRARKAGA